MGKTSRSAWPQPIVKLLFGRAANRCTICKCAITELPETAGDKIVVLGQIGHMHALSAKGPRATTSLTKKQLNDYPNLILLCANCHIKIDRKEVTYSIDELKRLKAEHEAAVERIASTLNPKQAEQILEIYLQEFQTAYKKDASRFVLSSYKIGEQIISGSELPDDVYQTNTMVLGGSGLGKSSLAKQVAMKTIEQDNVPIIVEAIQFSKHIEPHFDQEHGVVTSTFHEVEYACTILRKNVLLIVDGYNECPDSIRVKLNLWIIGITNRLLARVLITSQQPIAGLISIPFVAFELLAPSSEAKKQIALAVNPATDIDKVTMLLDAVSTGLEARLIGEVSQKVSPNSSRYAVYDMYARESFVEHGELGITMLSTIAEYLYQRITFSLSIRELGRLLSAKQLTLQPHEFLFASGLLSKRGDRVFFSHELFLNAFSAEAIVRNSSNNARKILAAIAAPKHSGQRALVVGAIEDQSLLDTLLPQITDFDLVASCLAGDCGAYAIAWADRECLQLFDKMEKEINAFSFDIVSKERQDGEPSWDVSLNEDSLYQWNEQEICFIHALPLSLFRGKHIEEIFEMVGHMDTRLSQEFTRLRPIAKEKNINIRSTMFENAYIGWGRSEVSTVMILKNFISGGWSIDQIQPSVALLKFCKELLARDSVTDGQLFLLIHLIQRFRWSHQEWKSVITSYVPYLLKERWKYSPYHLKMALLDAAHYSWDAPQEVKDQIIEQLNILLEISRDNWLMPTFIIDALQALGALEDDEHAYEETVRNELARIFSGGEKDPELCAEAYGFHIRTIDHPYHNAYWKIVSELNEADAKKLYTMALRGAVGNSSSFGNPMCLYYVARFEDPATADAILPFTKIPPVDESMAQSATETCLLAHVSLGWMGVTFHSQLDDENNVAAKAYLAYAEIMYWTNRRDLDLEDKKTGMDKAWRILKDAKLGVSVDVLRNFNSIANEGIGYFAKGKQITTSMLSAYPDDVAEICRQGLENANIQSGYFRWERKNEIISHAIQQLGYCGTVNDLALLKGYSSHKEFGGAALRAIERIESRHQN